jgi:hypothetical protein
VILRTIGNRKIRFCDFYYLKKPFRDRKKSSAPPSEEILSEETMTEV